MNDKRLDKLFREKLYSHSSPVEKSGELWEGIASSLDKGVGPVGLPLRKFVYIISAVAAVIIAAYFLFAPSSHKPYMPEKTEVSVIAGEVETVPQRSIICRPIFQPKYQPVKKKQKLVLPSVPLLSSSVAEDSLADPVYMAEVGDNKEAVPVKEDTRVTEFTDDFYSLFKEDAPPLRKRSSGYSLALASNIISGNSMDVSSNGSRKIYMSAGTAGTSQGGLSIEQVSDTKYSLPVNLGLQLQIRINHIFAVGVGINYTMLRSKYDGLLNKKMHSVKQTLHYIGIPVNFYGTILSKKGFSLYANLGGTLEKGIRASYFLKSYDGTVRYNTEIEGMQFSANFGLGIEYRIVKQLGLYLEPNAVYFFDSKVPNSIRTDQPFQLKAEIGFRFHL